MNVLTKAFVVVVTILAVVLVALVVPFAAQVPDYAGKYRDMKSAYEAQLVESGKAAEDARTQVAAKGLELEEMQKEVEALTSQLAMATADKSALQAKLAQADTTMARNAAALEVANRANEAKDGQITEQASVIQKMTATLGELNGQNADLNQTIIAVRAENRRLSNNYLRIQEENRALVQQLAEAQTQVKEYLALAEGAGVDLTKIDTPPVPEFGTEIQGSVTQIDQVSDVTFVQVNVGTRDKVKQGMEFTVYRGDQFVGKIQIASVDTAESVGKLTLGSGVKQGDKVLAGGR